MRISSLPSKPLSSARLLMKPTWLIMPNRRQNWTRWLQAMKKPRPLPALDTACFPAKSLLRVSILLVSKPFSSRPLIQPAYLLVA
ncbi:hypothetical protein L3X38_032882 [Prunus dulcis]|uniref:Uncharacterized protein n=1 Tax=Prunus dulcis TaxID=3755 RepID=A0AAD4VGB3_PRUDU|nr:hypothetical protein L3X38_032882 [Prunus dulcis]